MTELQTFSDVPVMPLQAFFEHDPQGGALWPDFELQTTARFCRNHGVPVDQAPVLEQCDDEIKENCIWGGYIHPHFGHLIAEHLTRILPSIHARPDDLVLFYIEKQRDPNALPSFFYDILNWYGLPRHRIKIIAKPTLARTLSVMPQGEVLWGKAPDAGYLDLLDALPSRNGLTPKESGIIYVSRSGLVRKGQGSHLGEDYLIQHLQDMGVEIIDPAQLTLVQQLAYYSGAKTLIFAEGSSIHGRQLLGRVGQDIFVLKRRGRYLARPMLKPRARKVTYINSNGGTLRVRDGRNNGYPHLNAVFYQTEPLLDCFDQIGLKLRAKWDQKAYLAAAFADASAWENAKHHDKVLSDQNADVYLAEKQAAHQNADPLLH